MREVAVFLCPSLYDSNPSFVNGLKKNDIHVTRFSIDLELQQQRKRMKEGKGDSNRNPYLEAVAKHNERIANSPEGKFSQYYDSSSSNGEDADNHNHNRIKDYHFLCIAMEDSIKGIKLARKAGMCTVGFGSNEIDVQQMMELQQKKGSECAPHAVAFTIGDLLRKFRVANYYQVQYLPYSIYLQNIVNKKVGYPVSLLDTLRGRFVVNSNENEDTTEIDVEDDEEDSDKQRTMELDVNASRIIPRDVLGITPGSLADVYINNVGWPQDKINTFHFNSRGLEMDVIRMFAKLYETPYEEMRGFVTSGGTEGNFSGLWWQRDYLKEKSNDGSKPILLTSNMTHYSISKAAQQLEIEGRLIQTNSKGELDCEDLERVLSDISEKEPARPILMNVNFGSTCTGSLDDLPTIHRILKKRGVVFSIHIDAALMGAVVPVIKPFGESINYFKDFDVKTIAISGHKFFGSVCICGVLLTSTQFLEDCEKSKSSKEVKYLTGLHDITPSGSRSGFNVLSFHNTLCGLYMHTDFRRLKDVVKHCYSCVQYFMKKMKELISEENIIAPKNSLTVCFPRPSDQMMEKWSLMPVNMPSPTNNKSSNEKNKPIIEMDYAGVCILANVDQKRIDNFMLDYKKDKMASAYFS